VGGTCHNFFFPPSLNPAAYEHVYSFKIDNFMQVVICTLLVKVLRLHRGIRRKQERIQVEETAGTAYIGAPRPQGQGSHSVSGLDSVFLPLFPSVFYLTLMLLLEPSRRLPFERVDPLAFYWEETGMDFVFRPLLCHSV